MRRIRLAGVYKIKHKVSGMVYIGCSVSVFDRWSGHHNDIKMNRHSSIAFQNLWNSSCPEDWEWSILETVSITEHRTTTGLKGKGLQASFRKLLLAREKEHMNKISQSLALNKDNKYFAKD